MKVLILIWLVATCTGFWELQKFENTPGVQLTAPSSFAIKTNDERDLLILFAQPGCGCSLSSLSELSHIEEATLHRLDVLIDIPTCSADAGEVKLLVAKAIDCGYQVKLDRKGRYADCFNAKTSGFCVLLDPHGHKLFQGGITAGRGGEGPNPGRDSVIALVERKPAPVTSWPVYGCALANRGSF